MKKLIILSVICLLTNMVFAQNNILRLDYKYTIVSEGKETIYDYRLHTSPERSMFYNTISLWLDSESRTDAGRTAYGEMASSLMAKGMGSSVPNRSANIFVNKIFTDNNMRVYDDFDDQFGFYDEKFDEMQWVICDSVKSLLDYECILAEIDYHGRHWKVWFSPEIPIQDGPWKFHGLPGLILSAEDSSGMHKFESTGLEQTKTPISIMYRSDFYTNEDRKTFLTAKRQYFNNPIAYIMQSQGLEQNTNIKILDSNGNEIDSKSIIDTNYDFLETDYR